MKIRTRLLKIVLILIGVLLIVWVTTITQSIRFEVNTHSHIFLVFFCVLLYVLPVLAAWRWRERPKTSGITTNEIRAALQRNQRAKPSRADNP